MFNLKQLRLRHHQPRDKTDLDNMFGKLFRFVQLIHFVIIIRWRRNYQFSLSFFSGLHQDERIMDELYKTKEA